MCKKPIIVNLFAGPGTGKSTAAAQIFSELKWSNVNCEMVREFAKDKVWEESYKVLDNQIYVFAKQFHRMNILINSVDVIITDSPILLSIIYDKEKNRELKELIIKSYNNFNNLNYFLVREKSYNPKGRLQDENQAKMLDNEIISLLLDLKIPFSTITGNKYQISTISKEIISLL